MAGLHKGSKSFEPCTLSIEAKEEFEILLALLSDTSNSNLKDAFLRFTVNGTSYGKLEITHEHIYKLDHLYQVFHKYYKKEIIRNGKD